MKNTTKEILIYLHENLGNIYEKVTEGTIYTPSMLAGRDCREVGFIIPKHVNQGLDFEAVSLHMVGDSGHGRSFPQIDDRSYPQFTTDTPLSNVEAYEMKSIECLEEKRKYLDLKGWTKEKLGEDKYLRAIFASYNCGQGNVNKALSRGLDVDRYTFSSDYSKSVMEYRYLYFDLYYQNNGTYEGIFNTKHDEEVPECAKAVDGHNELNGEAKEGT